LLVQIFKLVREELDLILGGRAHVLAGKTIFSTEDLSDNIEIACKLHGTEYTFIVNASQKTPFSGADLTEGAKSDEHGIFLNLISNIVKDAFRSTHLKQIGMQPRFFDLKKAVPVMDTGLMACPGFRASPYSYTSGLTLVIDSVTKFV
jgi:hypothetical protein